MDSKKNEDEKVCEWCRKTFSRVDLSSKGVKTNNWFRMKYCSVYCRFTAANNRVRDTCIYCGSKLAQEVNKLHLRECAECRSKRTGNQGKSGPCTDGTVQKIMYLLANDPGARELWNSVFPSLDEENRKTLKSQEVLTRIGRKR